MLCILDEDQTPHSPHEKLADLLHRHIAPPENDPHRAALKRMIRSSFKPARPFCPEEPVRCACRDASARPYLSQRYGNLHLATTLR